MSPVDTEEELLPVRAHRAARFDVLPEHLEGIIIDREGPLPAVLQFRGNRLLHPDATPRAEPGCS